MSGKREYLLQLRCGVFDIGYPAWLGENSLDLVTCRENAAATVQDDAALRLLGDDCMLLLPGALAVVIGAAILQIKQPPPQQSEYPYCQRQYDNNGSGFHFLK